MAFFGNFKKSALELKTIRCIVVTGLLIALELAIKQLTIRVTPDLKISFAFLAKACIGMLYGPTVGFLAGGVSDVVSFFMKPQTDAFSPLFTLQECLAGMLYGLFLYKLRMSRISFKDKTLFKQSVKDNGKQILRIVMGKLSVTVGINLLYTPFAQVVTNSMEAGAWVWGSVLVKYPARLLKNAIQYPVDCVMLMLVLPIVATAYYAVFKDNKKTIGET
ncbi:MAG: folate family ECF transporter S component [Oscillospiraceae bacterium]